MYLKVIFLFLFYVFSISVLAQEKLIFAMDVVRHGDRTPITNIPTVSHHWKEGLGQLTATGMRQEYELGKQLRKKYVDQYHLLPEKYHPDALYVRSTDTDRTLTSAQSLLMGLYPETGPSLPDQNKPALPSAFQPIPIHTVPREQETWFANLKKEEPTHQALVQLHVFSKSQWKSKAQALQPKFKEWSEAAGVPINSLEDLISLGDNLYIQDLYRVPLPKGITAEDAKQIMEAGRWAFVQLYKPTQIGKHTAQDVLKTLRQYLQEASLQKSKQKYRLFLAHDSTLLSLMSALGAALEEAPPYASHLNFSLYEVGNQQYQVKVEFNNKPVQIPTCKKSTCSLSEFMLTVADISDKALIAKVADKF